MRQPVKGSIDSLNGLVRWKVHNQFVWTWDRSQECVSLYYLYRPGLLTSVDLVG